MQGHTLEGAHVDRITIEPRGYKLAQVDHLQELEGAVVPDTHGILGVICDSTQDTKLAEAIVRIDCDGAGSIPICITHSIEGFTGRHVFELSCALWVYNCTGMAVAIREYEDCEPFVDEEVRTCINLQYAGSTACLNHKNWGILVYLKYLQQPRDFELGVLIMDQSKSARLLG